MWPVVRLLHHEEYQESRFYSVSWGTNWGTNFLHIKHIMSYYCTHMWLHHDQIVKVMNRWDLALFFITLDTSASRTRFTYLIFIIRVRIKMRDQETSSTKATSMSTMMVVSIHRKETNSIYNVGPHFQLLRMLWNFRTFWQWHITQLLLKNQIYMWTIDTSNSKEFARRQ